ncbi:MAG: HepT-like ribonuclease domain-containing protein [Nitrospirota bacterium]|jgi:uncharacterized protein YutE (UPF0331/DUF86 family)
MRKSQTYEIIAFLKEEISYFNIKSKGVSFDKFTSDKDLRKILNATLNEIVLATVDLAGECLRKAGRRVPNTYREIILTTRDFLGDIALKAAPLAKLRNETIHEYMNINWKNIQYLRSRGLNIVERYLKKAEEFLR